MKKGLKFSFNVSSLTNYTDETSLKLLLRSFVSPKTYTVLRSAGADLEIGIKSSKKLQKLAVTAVPQTNSGCGFNASGSQAFTQATLTVGKFKWQDTMCPKDLESKWTQKLLSQGQNYDENSVSANSVIEDALISLIKEQLETMDWQGDTASGNEYLNKYDGLIKLLDAAGGMVAGNTGAITSLTNTNTFTAVVAMCDAIPEALKDKEDLILCMGTDTFDKYSTNLLNLNLFHHISDATNYEATVPAKGKRIVGLPGLSGTNRMFLFRASNITWGTDMEGEEEDFRIWYSQDDDVVRYSVKGARGVQAAYPNEIVQFTLA